eukprot:7609794-Heterocapsa_arctica.AAC.1
MTLRLKDFNRTRNPGQRRSWFVKTIGLPFYGKGKRTKIILGVCSRLRKGRQTRIHIVSHPLQGPSHPSSVIDQLMAEP